MKRALCIAILSMGGLITVVGTAIVALSMLGLSQANELDDVKF